MYTNTSLPSLSRDRMSSPEPRPARHVPPRDLPIPRSISEAAQAQMAIQRPPPPPYPALEDLDGWRAYAGGMNQAMLPTIRAWAAKVRAGVEDVEANGA